MSSQRFLLGEFDEERFAHLSVSLRQNVKRYAPRFVQRTVWAIRARLAAPAIEDLKLHDYRVVSDESVERRVSLVIPTIDSGAAFGGIITGLELFLEIGLRARAEMRVILDDYVRQVDRSVLDRYAQARGIDPCSIKVEQRKAENPEIEVRSSDVFITFNWWVTLNTKRILEEQRKWFGKAHPYIYILQDYEPQFYPFSSSHMLARAALDHTTSHWTVINSHELYRYYLLQGHAAERAFVFEPALSSRLRPFLGRGIVPRKKQILVYGRPNIPRNCFPAIVRGINRWIRSEAEHAQWRILSAGEMHNPVELANGRFIEPLGKLTLDQYGELLNSTAVGISLMASPHPSYPPLEMAHFGLLTITNSYTSKNLADSHENIISLMDISEERIADALREACLRSQQEGAAKTLIPQFLREDPFTVVADIADALDHDVWR